MSLSQKIDTIKTKQLVLKNSFTIPVDPRTNLTLTGQLLSREGVGAGNLFMKLNHRPNSKLSIEVGYALIWSIVYTF
jgi:DnaJ family protein C protein 11